MIVDQMNIVLDVGTTKPLLFQSQIQHVEAKLAGNNSISVTTVLRPVGFARQDAERLTRVALQDSGNLPRSEWSFQDIVKFRVQGDHKLIGLAMRNCVE